METTVTTMKQFIFTRPFEVETKGNDVFLDGFISTTDKDLVNDVITRNCLKSMLAQIQDKNIKLDLEHESFRGDSHEEKEINKTKVPVGRIVDGTLSDNKLRIKALINKFHQRFDETKGSLQEGFLDAFSIAYIPTKIAMEEKDGEQIRLLDDLTLLNVALTGNPVNTSAQIREVMVKSMDSIEVKPEDEDDEEKKKIKRSEASRRARAEAIAEGDDEGDEETKKPKKKNAMDEFNTENKDTLEVKDAETKPFAGFRNFAACVSKMKKTGKSDDVASKICGRLQERHEKKGLIVFDNEGNELYSHNSELNNDKEVKNMTEEQETAQVKDEEVVETPEEPKEPTEPEPAPEPKPEPTPAEPAEDLKAIREDLEAMKNELAKLRTVNSKAIKERMPEVIPEGKSVEPLDVIQ